MSDLKSRGDMSIEDILQSIRNVINSKTDIDEELELTEIAYPDESEIDEVGDNSLLSEDSSALTQTIIENFVETACSLGHHVVEDKAKAPKVKTIEDFVVDMLKPQMKEWLDDNLPLLVKQVVSEEIRRLVAKMKPPE